MISFSDISKLFSFNLEGKYCIEIEFSVKGNLKYQSCWMGKLPNEINKKKDLYWFGLAPDGSEAYDYDNFCDFSSAPVFGGKSLQQIWSEIEIFTIDGCNPNERLQLYL